MIGLSLAILSGGWFLEVKAGSLHLQAESSPSPASTAIAPTPGTATPGTATAQTAHILAPGPGAAIQGITTITGSSAVPGFVAAEVDFAYSGDDTHTWFRITTLTEPVTEGVLASWDTTTITDGIYDLRLVVYLQDGSQARAQVPGIRVRNYSPVETNTPTPQTPTATRVPGDTPIPTPTATPTLSPPPPTPTDYPRNPAEISRQDVTGSFIKGSVSLIGLFALIGAYLLVKKIIRRPGK